MSLTTAESHLWIQHLPRKFGLYYTNSAREFFLLFINLLVIAQRRTIIDQIVGTAQDLQYLSHERMYSPSLLSKLLVSNTDLQKLIFGAMCYLKWINSTKKTSFNVGMKSNLGSQWCLVIQYSVGRRNDYLLVLYEINQIAICRLQYKQTHKGSWLRSSHLLKSRSFHFSTVACFKQQLRRSGD